MNQITHIMLIEDHPEYREVIEMALQKSPDFILDAQFGTAEMALRSIQDQTLGQMPNVILLDLNLPGMSGLEAIPWLQEYLPKSHIIVLTQSDRETDVLAALRLGAAGYLLKSATVTQIKDGIRSVTEGGSPLDSGVARFILETLKVKPPKSATQAALSGRELEVLTLLAEGMAKKEIAQKLAISTSTVITHVSHIYEKLNAANAPAAIHQAHRLGLFDK